MKKIIKKLQNWCLPYTCVLCGAPGEQIDLCLACQQELPWVTQGCPSCARPLPVAVPAGQRCGHCLQDNIPFHQIIALFQYQTPIDRLITGLKFQQKLIYAKLLGELLAQQLTIRYQTESFPECIIPMPLHHERLRERGFNQAVEIGRTLARKMKIKMDLQSCKRTRATVAQTILPAAQRQHNVKNAFYVNSPLCTKHIAILDDVVTTGHTITELSRVLNNAGVERIDVWCCARTNLLGA